MSRRIAFVAPPFAGHLNPLVVFAKAAQAAGYEVEVLTGPGKIETIVQAGVPAYSLQSLSEGGLEAIADTSHKVGSNPVRLSRQMRAAFEVMSGVRDELAERWRAKRPDLVVADFAAVPAGIAADAIGAPWITVMRAAFALEGVRGPPSYLGGLRPWPGPLGALRDRLGWWGVRLGKDGLALLFAGDLKRLGVQRRRPDGSEAIYSAQRILALELHELEFDRDWPPALRFIGPIADNPEVPVELNLPPSRPRVLVTLGTHLPWAKAALPAQVKALAERLPEVSFVVSMGRPQSAGSAPLRLAPNVLVYEFVPYVPHLPHMDAVIHHGGAGVTGACIAAGRPSLVFPQDYDQFDYAARIVHHGLGRRTRDLAAPETASALQALLAEPLPALPRFQTFAAAYRPVASFLAEVEHLIGREALASFEPPFGSEPVDHSQ